MKYNNIICGIEPSQSMNRGLSKGEFINLAIGAPDIDPPNEVLQALQDFSNFPNVKYFNTKGSERARLNVNDFLSLGAANAFQEISLVSGAKFGIYNTLNTILNRGEKVGLFPPYWLSYPEINRILGLDSLFFDVKVDSSKGALKYDLDSIKSKIEKDQVRCVIINNPNNPTGQLFDQLLFDELVTFCEKKEVWLVLDEVYKDLVFPGQQILRADPSNNENLIRIGSLSKSLAIPGLRAGYIYGTSEFITNFNLSNQHISTCINSMTNFVLEKITKERFCKFKEETNLLYEARYALANKLLSDKGYSILDAKSGFYLLVDVSSKFENGEAACDHLEKKGVLVTPGRAYGQQFASHVRLCLTVDDSKLKKAIAYF